MLGVALQNQRGPIVIDTAMQNVKSSHPIHTNHFASLLA
jgi:hypothetical protein